MPKPIFTAALIFFSAVAGFTFAEMPGLSAEPSGQYLKEWLLCGAFPVLTEAEQDIEAIRLPGMYADFLKDSGGEANARPVAGQVVAYPGWLMHVGTPCRAGQCR